MKNIGNLISRNNWIFLIPVLAFATVFYLYNLGFKDLWSDEIYTKAIIDCSLQELFVKLRNDLHPPLYYLSLKLFTSLFGLSAMSMRVFSVIGVLSIFIIGYFAGQKIFGRQGALYFCLMLLSIPMLAWYSHEARMYTWAAFATTGVFINSCLFLKTGNNKNLIFLFVFTLAAIYMHYYSMIAAFTANAYVLIYMLVNKRRKWMLHLITMVLVVASFIPWLPLFIVQVKKVQHAFWAPEVNFSTILACFTIPFTEQYWTTGYSIALIILMYSLLLFTVFKSFTKPFSEYRIILWLALTVFLGTLLIATIISLFSQPILVARYVMTIVVMLIIPHTILLMHLKSKALKYILVAIPLFLSLKVSYSTFFFSYGPYNQTVQHLVKEYPDINKIVHITEITAGPLMEYSKGNKLQHYWLKADMSNVDAFTTIHQYNQPREFLNTREEFCVVKFNNLNLNQKNLDLILSESDIVKTDTVWDNKVEYGNSITIYHLRYKGEKDSSN
jgi:uncharacterized membrane protein